MPKEIEAKFRVDSHEAVRHKLQACGGECLGKVLEHNRIYDHRDGSLSNKGCGLRIRSCLANDDSLKSATVTFKGPVESALFKTREEIETKIDDPQAMADLFDRIGFVPVVVYEKWRETWLLDACRIELDELPHLGLFVEIEGPGESDITVMQNRLGLIDCQHERASYVHLLVQFCKDHNLSSRVIKVESKS